MSENTEQKVLLVDDNQVDADLYADYFEHGPIIKPVTALSAEEGLSKLEQTDIDCVVSDSVQTNDGVPLVTVAKQNYPDLPVLLHSGRSADELPTEIVDDFLRKGTKTDSSTALETLRERVRELTTRPPAAPGQNDSGKQWQSLGTFDWTDRDQSAVAIIEALAERSESDPLEIGPLYESIDPDALKVLMTHAATKETSNTIQVQFDLSGYTVRTRSDGTVQYREDDC